MLIRFIHILSFWVIAFSCNAQNIQWVKQVGDKHGESGSLCKLIPDGRSIVSWYFADSTKIDSFKIIKKSSVPSVLALLRKDGKAKWIWTPDSASNYMIVFSICYSESSAKIYFCGNFTKKATINGINYKGENNGFIIRMDTNGIFESIYVLSNPDKFLFETMILNNRNEIILGVSLTNANSKLTIPEVGFSMSKQGYFTMKFDENLLPIQVSEPVYGDRWGRLAICLTPSKAILNTYTFQDTVVIDNKKYFNGKDINTTYITWLDSNLKVIKNALLYTSNVKNYNSIYSVKTLSDGSILLGGTYQDSISLIPLRYPDSQVPFFVCLDSNLKLKWYKSPQIINGENIYAEVLDMAILDDYIYVGGMFVGHTIYREFDLPNNEGCFWFFKTDKLGNILWMNKIGKANYNQPLSSISVNQQREIMLSGIFLDTAQLYNQVYITEKGRPDVLLIKIYNIDIIRGYVKNGPYCAGDTIKIPYTKNGKYNKNNQFIAQLSDEHGEFIGGERELGRISSDTAGTILGILPLFDVESSPHYRIRIISTNPLVQSYYKYDTLRLLIYSRDTANAGKDTLICKGQSVNVTTTGGTRWRWSPGTMVLDSSSKSTVAFPSVTTRFRIIISDSSGCGKTDTAYKTITARPPLKILGLPKDTTVCKDKRVWFKMTPSGGLGANYTFQWLSVFNQPLGFADTISIKATDEGIIKAVLRDGCSAGNDTFLIDIKFPVVTFSQLLKDTLVCPGSEPLLKLIPSKGLNSDYSYAWYSNLQLLAATDTLRHKITQAETLKAVLTHSCSGQKDTSFIKLMLPHAISAFIEKPTCFDSSLNLKITASGGYKNILNHVWYFNDKAFDIGKNIFLTGIGSKQKLLVITSDYCKTNLKDSIILYPKPKAYLNVSDDSVCLGYPVTILNYSKYFTPVHLKLSWLSHQRTWKNKDTSIVFNQSGQQTIEIEITDSLGCLDAASASLTVIENPDATFDINPPEVTTDHAFFELMPVFNHYKKYRWTLNGKDEQHSGSETIRLFVKDTITHRIRLIVSNDFGCKDTAEQILTVKPSEAFWIPNAVSCNDDGLNDEFAPYGWKVESYEMLIVSRSKQVVYKGNTPWKPVNEAGVYSYILKVKFKDGSSNSFKGLIHVLN